MPPSPFQRTHPSGPFGRSRWRAALLFAAALLSACEPRITAPRCATAEDCDRTAGYIFCRGGYCFRTPAPPGQSDATDDAAARDGDDAAPPPADDAGDTGEAVCAPGQSLLGAADDCCPAWGGHDLATDPDCHHPGGRLDISSQPLGVAVLPASTPTGVRWVVVAALRASPQEPVYGVAMGLDPDTTGVPVWREALGRTPTALPPTLSPDGRLATVVGGGRVRTLAVTDGATVRDIAAAPSVCPLPLGDGSLLVAEADGGLLLAPPPAESNGAPEAPARIPGGAGGAVTRAHPVAATTAARAYVVTDDGVVVCVDPTTRAVAWRTTLDHPPLDHAPVATPDGVVVYHERGFSFVPDAGTAPGAVVLQALPADPVGSPVCGTDGRLWVVTADATVFTFGMAHDRAVPDGRHDLAAAPRGGVTPLILPQATGGAPLVVVASETALFALTPDATAPEWSWAFAGAPVTAVLWDAVGPWLVLPFADGTLDALPLPLVPNPPPTRQSRAGAGP